MVLLLRDTSLEVTLESGGAGCLKSSQGDRVEVGGTAGVWWGKLGGPQGSNRGLWLRRSQQRQLGCDGRRRAKQV